METNDKKRRLPNGAIQDQIPVEDQMTMQEHIPVQEPMRVGGFDMAGQKSPDDAMDGFRALSQVIGKEQVQEARQTLMRYKEGKANLERKVIEAEQWYKLRNWECLRLDSKGKNQVEPVSGWLFNSIANKHADAMDNFPSPKHL